jgi:hypothetical protein
MGRLGRTWGTSLATLAVLVAAGALSGSAASAEDQLPNPFIPAEDPITVPAAFGPVVSSTRVLYTGEQYRVVVDGSYDVDLLSTPPSVVHYDAIYCFDETPRRQFGCSANPREFDYAGLRFKIGDSAVDEFRPIYKLVSPTAPDFRDDHHYEFTFTAQQTGKLNLRIQHSTANEDESVFGYRLKGGAGKPPVLLGCTITQPGLRIEIDPSKRGATMRSALGTGAKVIIGRLPTRGASRGARLNMAWSTAPR